MFGFREGKLMLITIGANASIARLPSCSKHGSSLGERNDENK